MRTHLFNSAVWSVCFVPVFAETGVGAGPLSFDQALLETTRTNANATGSVSLDGRASSWPSELNWNATLDVKEIPFDGQIITNSVLSIVATPDLSNDIWKTDTCAFVYTDVKRAATVKGQKDDGDCYATLGEECAQDLTKAILMALPRREGTINNRTGVCEDLSMPLLPDTCKDVLGPGAFHQKLTANLTHGSPWIYEASKPHAASNLTDYHSAATKVWPIVLVQGPRTNFSGTTSSGISCLRAQSVSDGSKSIGDVPAAATQLGYGTLGALGFACAGLLLA